MFFWLFSNAAKWQNFATILKKAGNFQSLTKKKKSGTTLSMIIWPSCCIRATWDQSWSSWKSEESPWISLHVLHPLHIMCNNLSLLYPFQSLYQVHVFRICILIVFDSRARWMHERWFYDSETLHSKWFNRMHWMVSQQYQQQTEIMCTQTIFWGQIISKITVSFPFWLL